MGAAFSIALTVFLASFNCAKAADDSLTSLVMKSDAVKFRIAKSHAIRAGLQAAEGDGEPSVHVYLTLKEHAYPYVISLGNFVVLKSKDGEVKVLDEFGEKLPLPNRQPERVGFHKGDLLALKAFDFVTEGLYGKALKALDQAIDLAPNSYRLHSNRGALLVLMGKDRAESMKEFAEAIKLNPNCAAAYSNRACLNLSLNKQKLAAEDAKIALKIEPSLNAARLCLVRSNLEEGKEEDAAALLEKSGLSSRNDAQSLKLQAETLIATKDYKGARAVLRSF